MRVITLSGPGEQRGHQYGSALAPEIGAALDALSAHLTAQGHDPRALAQRLAASPIVDTTSRHCPDLWAETVAMADAAGITLADACLLTLLDEVWGLTAPGCSVLARRTVDGTEVGQTMDLPAWTVGRLVVLRVHPGHGPAQLVMSYPGDLGLCGASQGVSVAVNALAQFGMDESGVAVAYVLRHLLTMTSVDEAADFLASIPHAAGQAYTVADATTVATFEAGPGVFRRVTDAGAKACAHTNHPLDRTVRPDRSTSIRLASLERSIAGDHDLQSALSGDVVLDGERYQDPHSTFAAFAHFSDRDSASFIDGVDLRHGSTTWTDVTFR